MRPLCGPPNYWRTNERAVTGNPTAVKYDTYLQLSLSAMQFALTLMSASVHHYDDPRFC
jgi:hypothetical protein